MALPQKKNANENALIPPQLSTGDNEIVISGISGKFPNSNNIAEFEYNLYNKIDMIDDKETRWKHFNDDIPKRMGKMNNIEKFDATFFGVHYKHAQSMDPLCRMIMEISYEAVLDAGLNPKVLRGTKTGVFVAACQSETEKVNFYEKMALGDFGITGTSRSMFPNRISYSLGLHGPSLLIDTGCSSSMHALDCAYNAIKFGGCDAAIIAGANLISYPHVTLQFVKLGNLSPDGHCRPFDRNANGYVRAEGICAMLLQRAKDAKRIYSTVVYTKTNCDGFKKEGITAPSVIAQTNLLEEIYKEIDIDPSALSYVETHGTGILADDFAECQSMDNALCRKRNNKPLLIGSVKSNMGHSEATSSLSSLVKVILAFERGLIAPNINFSEMRTDIPALVEGRLKVCSEPTILDGSLIGVNSFGFAGSNAHAIFRRHSKEKLNDGVANDQLPRLVNWSGRTEESINVLFTAIESHPLDAEFIGLLHNVQREEIPGYFFRGYSLYRNNADDSAICITKDVQRFTGVQRPIVWVFSGMGSQWNKMGTSLLQLPVFKESLQKCHQALEPYGLDLINIITSPDDKIYLNILNSFVGIAAIQVGIVDILRALDMDADLYIGHSFGELACAYADGCFTREQTVLSAYFRGITSLETKTIPGSIAAIGLGYKQVKNMLPQTIQVACHNGPDSSTISGPKDDIANFITKLSDEKIFAKEIYVANIAYHSKYITDMGPHLLNYLEKIIPTPKKRSSKWLSTSVPKQNWDNEDNQYSSAKYHTNNLLNFVLFEETALFLPSNCITMEIAPHGLLQPVLKKLLPNGLHIPLTQKGSNDNIAFFLNAMGKLYMTGMSMPIEKLYPKIEYPVSRGTPMISPLIRWDHGTDWYIEKYEHHKSTCNGERTIEMSLDDINYEYIAGNIVDGRCFISATGYLHLVWETFAMMNGKDYRNVSVEFEDVKMTERTTMARGETVKLTVMILVGTGRFEISDNRFPLATGFISEIENPTPIPDSPEPPLSKLPFLNADDFYKELRLRGYQYDGAFRSVLETRGDGICGKVLWRNNWVTFLDSILQAIMLGQDTRALGFLTGFKKIIINVKEHAEVLSTLDPIHPIFKLQYIPQLGAVVSAGVEISGMSVVSVAKSKPVGKNIIETYEFIPYIMTSTLDSSDAVNVFVQLLIENKPISMELNAITAIEIINIDEPIIQYVSDAIDRIPFIGCNLTLLTQTKNHPYNIPEKIQIANKHISMYTNCDLIIVRNGLSSLEFIAECERAMKETAYLISRETIDINIENITNIPGFELLSVIPTTSDETLLLYQKIHWNKIAGNTDVIYVTTNDINYKWLLKLQQQIIKDNYPLILVAQQEQYSGIIGLVNCLRKECYKTDIICVYIDDPKAPPFAVNHKFYKEQLDKNLMFNIYRKGKWGHYKYFPIRESCEEKIRKDYYFANIIERADLQSLKWFEGAGYPATQKDVINVHYVGLNYRDLIFVTGIFGVEIMSMNRLDQECVISTDYAGTNIDGENVMGLIKYGAMATQLVHSEFIWKVPKSWTLREAVTCPTVYLTVYTAFFMYNGISKGKSILIHCGSGGIGLAAIRIALAYGMNVFTTVSSPEKKSFIMDTFPQLEESNIGNSRDCSFELMVKFQTHGRGVDYVLNMLSGDKLHASIRCLGYGGTFLEIGNADVFSDNTIGLGYFLQNLLFRTISIYNFINLPSNYRTMIMEKFQNDLNEGIIQPLHSTEFQPNDLMNAFLHLTTGKHIGKVVIKLREKQNDKFTVPLKVQARSYFDSNSVYIVTGGLGGFGLEFVDWMIIRGARKFIISSKSGLTQLFQLYRVRLWETYGCTLIESSSDITSLQETEKLFGEALNHGEIGGIFNLAMKQRNATIEHQTVDSLNECIAPKLLGTKYLDELSRKMCPNLKYFVVFSSYVSGRGNIEQLNFGIANSVIEQIIEKRVASNLPAKAIQWGAVDDIGLVSTMKDDKLDMNRNGLELQRIAISLRNLDELMSKSIAPIVSSLSIADKNSEVVE